MSLNNPHVDMYSDSRHIIIIGGGVAGISCAQELLHSHSLLSSQRGQQDNSSVLFKITLLNSSPYIKKLQNFTQITPNIQKFDVVDVTNKEEVFESLLPKTSSLDQLIQIISCTVHSIDFEKKTIFTNHSQIPSLTYHALCIASGASPKPLPFTIHSRLEASRTPKTMDLDQHLNRRCPHHRIISIRDTDSVQKLIKLIETSSRVAIIGNGGVAMELVYAIQNCQVMWVVKDAHIGNAFFDEETSQFLRQKIGNDLFSDVVTVAVKGNTSENGENVVQVGAQTNGKRSTKHENLEAVVCSGPSLGPQWSHMSHKSKEMSSQMENLSLKGKSATSQLKILLSTNVEQVISKQTNENTQTSEPYFALKLSNGEVVDCDIIINATGIIPNINFLKHSDIEFETESDAGSITASVITDLDADMQYEEVDSVAVNHISGGILVDLDTMQTSVPFVFAAGDCAKIRINQINPDSNWFQMRLWNEGLKMGTIAAKSIISSLWSLPREFLGLEFELFTHTTKFFDRKIILLGRYNAQGLCKEYKLITGSGGLEKGAGFARVVLQEGKMRGAVLIGETNLEETYENLILSGLDVEKFGSDLVDPTMDIDDFFE